MRVLGVETSCDETAAAVVGPHGVVSDVVHSQLEHAEFGGVVPELAARAHIERLGVVVERALHDADTAKPDAVAATGGPGIIGAVLVGFSWAKALAWAWDVPFRAVNHLEGHLLSARMEAEPPEWPFLGLVVSGGHTTLYVAHALGRYEVLGQTVDDAAGEAFDKVARMLGLGYPGGPVVDRLAATGDPAAVAFPRPDPGGLDWSFSGLKTAVRQHVQSAARAPDADVCASFQAAVVDCLVDRVSRAVDRTGIRRLALAGGVAANRGLRERVRALGIQTVIPPIRRCTDNAAMIAYAGREHLMAGHADALDRGVEPAWALT
ncbi:MAG: tRNA (adenosine(37)-N6)-threonylcarbamoyltransferase complex transferase subunit TsaD [Myxococcota bacterium]